MATFSIYFHLFVIIPLLLYCGAIVLMQKQYKYFALIVLLVFLMILVVHIKDISNIINVIEKKKPFTRLFGIILIGLACFFLFFNIFKLSAKNKKK